MRTPQPSLLANSLLLLLASPFLLLPSAAAAAAASPSSSETTTITIRIPPSQALPNPNALPPGTHATLSAAGAALRSAPLSPGGALVFRNVSAGSYLADVWSGAFAFAPLRVDVFASSPGEGDEGSGGLQVRAWETFRGNDWDNKGEAVPVQRVSSGGGGGDGDGVWLLDARALGARAYFVERSRFSVFGVLRNPMILLGLVSMGIFLGMPYLVNNMDPEMRAEWEERQKSNPMNSLLGGGGGGGGGGAGQPAANPIGNFDMASFLAGSPASGSGSNGGGSGSSKKGKGGR